MNKGHDLQVELMPVEGQEETEEFRLRAKARPPSSLPPLLYRHQGEVAEVDSGL